MITRALRYAKGLAGLRHSDILLVSFPRSGNTWARIFLCNLLDLLEQRDEVVDFDRVNSLMPELGVDNLLKPWPHTVMPRFVKTHRPYMRLFRRQRAVLVLRDPRDVMRSYYDFEQAKRRPRFRGTVAAFARSRRFGFEPWFRHTRSWLPHTTYILRYDELRANDTAAFGEMITALNIAADPELVRQAAQRAQVERVRSAEIARKQQHSRRFQDGFVFARDGRAGTWEGVLAPAELKYYEQLKQGHGLHIY